MFWSNLTDQLRVKSYRFQNFVPRKNFGILNILGLEMLGFERSFRLQKFCVFEWLFTSSIGYSGFLRMKAIKKGEK